jgi:hypothetical protein
MIRNQQVSSSILLIGSKQIQGVTEKYRNPLFLYPVILSRSCPAFLFSGHKNPRIFSQGFLTVVAGCPVA